MHLHSYDLKCKELEAEPAPQGSSLTCVFQTLIPNIRQLINIARTKMHGRSKLSIKCICFNRYHTETSSCMLRDVAMHFFECRIELPFLTHNNEVQVKIDTENQGLG